MSGNGLRNACVPLFARDMVKAVTGSGAVVDVPHPAVNSAAFRANTTIVLDVRMVSSFLWMMNIGQQLRSGRPSTKRETGRNRVIRVIRRNGAARASADATRSVRR